MNRVVGASVVSILLVASLAGLQGSAVETRGQYDLGAYAVLAAPAVPADVVVLELGTNDIRTSLPPFAARYGEIVGLLRRDEPRARFACLGIWRALPTAATYDAVIQGVCPGAFVPLASLYADGTLHGPVGRHSWLGAGADWFHPSDAGHAAIAGAVLDALRASPA